MEKKFKLNQKVFDYSYGWGVVITEYIDGSISVKYSNSKSEINILYNKDGSYANGNPNVVAKPVLATKEYTLNCFTQKYKEDYEQYIGKLGFFWNYDSGKDLLISVLSFYNEENEYKFITNNDEPYEYFKPLTEEQIKILKL